MKNYETLADLRAKASFHIEKAFDRGYEQGFNDCHSELTEEEAKDHYNEGYNDGYEKGLKHGLKEAECAEACGMNRAWKAARKIVLSDEDGGIPIDNILKIYGMSYYGVMKNIPASEVIEKIDAWKKKQEQTKKSCDTCEYNNCEKTVYPCTACCSWNSKWTPKQDAPKMNVESIEVGDEVTYNIGNVMVVTRVYSESRSADLLRYDGTVEQQPLEILTPTGKHYDIQALFDAIKPSKPEEGGENVHE